MSGAEQPDEPRVKVYPPDEALQRAQPLPPRERLVIEDVPQDEWMAFQEALGGGMTDARAVGVVVDSAPSCARCRKIGHPPGSKVHDGDRWIAAAAIRLGLPLVSDDGVFIAAPRLELLTVAAET